jgi:hypothetical protein
MVDPPRATWVHDFIERNKERLKTKSPEVLQKERILACQKEKIIAWLDMLQEMFETNQYDDDLFIHMDETSCQVKPHRNAQRVVSQHTTFIPLLQQPPIYHLTALFIVTAAGTHLPTPLIFPKDYPEDILNKFDDDSFRIHQTQRGWMEMDLFETIIRGEVVDYINEKRRRAGDPNKRALILLDGHSSRRNLQLIKDLAAMGIDVVTLPAHTSHILQPLDLGSNAAFKRALRTALSPPGKRQMAAKLLPFIRSIADAVYDALRPKIVRGGFTAAGILGGDRTRVLSHCYSELPPGVTAPPASTRFSISGRKLTDPEFIREWELIDNARKEKANQKAARLDARRRKAVLDDEPDPIAEDIVDPEEKKEEEEDSQAGEDSVMTVTLSAAETETFEKEAEDFSFIRKRRLARDAAAEERLKYASESDSDEAPRPLMKRKRRTPFVRAITFTPPKVRVAADGTIIIVSDSEESEGAPDDIDHDDSHSSDSDYIE